MNTILIKREELINEFAEVINKNSLENESNTPDFILATYLVNCLESFHIGVRNRDNWYGGKQSILDMEKLEKWK